MSRISFCTRVRAISAEYSLSLNIYHRLRIGEVADDAPYAKIQARLPEGLDVFLASSLIISVSGMVDKEDVPSEVVESSATCRQLGKCLRLNSIALGIESVSDCKIDDSGIPRIILVPSRPLRPDDTAVHAKLVEIQLKYIWKTTQQEGSDSPPDMRTSPSLHDDPHPFDTRLLLPISLLLMEAHHKFLTWHLVKRYPLIFGPRAQNLDKELAYFTPISRAVCSIIARSPNPTFREEAQSRINRIKSQRTASLCKVTEAVLDVLGNRGANGSYFSAEERTDSDEDILCSAMINLFNYGTKRTQFRPQESVMQGGSDVELPDDDHIPTTEEDFVHLPNIEDRTADIEASTPFDPPLTNASNDELDALAWMLNAPLLCKKPDTHSAPTSGDECLMDTDSVRKSDHRSTPRPVSSLQPVTTPSGSGEEHTSHLYVPSTPNPELSYSPSQPLSSSSLVNNEAPVPSPISPDDCGHVLFFDVDDTENSASMSTISMTHSVDVALPCTCDEGSLRSPHEEEHASQPHPNPELSYLPSQHPLSAPVPPDGEQDLFFDMDDILSGTSQDMDNDLDFDFDLAAFDMDMDTDTVNLLQGEVNRVTLLNDSDSDGLEDFEDSHLDEASPVSISPHSHIPSALYQLIFHGGNASTYRMDEEGDYEDMLQDF
ncbi:hypothetical protein BDN71DRAFT_1512019 [Pleurotus eryngii]|uniref:Uncharacterized protein n=1 Tax=Pleurotus eryngii TaxID=5323 RepID=A0A9P6DAC5_PLEER|nr:hypothetical protein BDN71DRAFT_1512019 [Pleurotus eryngii]